MRCSDCGGHRRNPDNRRRRFERSAGQGDFRSQVQLLQLKMRSGEIPVDYVRRAAALGDKRAEALGLEPWPVDSPNNYPIFMRSILKRLPETLIVSFATDVAERVLYIFEDEYPGDTRPREAIEAARRWVEDPSDENFDAADAAAAADDANAYAAHAAANAAYATYTIWDAHYAADAAHYAALAEYYATYADDVAAYDAAQAAEEAWQKQRLIKYLLGEIEGDFRRNPQPEGDCFRWALMDAAKNGGVLVHGWVLNPLFLEGGIQDYMVHGWVERDGMVYDWQRCDQKMCEGGPVDIDEFYETYKPQHLAKYYEKVFKRAVDEGHYGPWHPEPWADLDWKGWRS